MRLPLLLFLLAAPLSAQSYTSLQSGTAIRVITTNGGRYEGDFLSLAGDTLRVREPRGAFRSTDHAVALPEVFAVERREPDYGTSIALSALLTGAGTAGMVAYGNSQGTSRANVPVFAALGAAAGAVVGAVMPMIVHWVPVPR